MAYPCSQTNDLDKMTSQTSNLRIGIAFGGGGAKGFAHIHAIKVFDKMGIRPVEITGASIGSIMGAGMAAGMTGAEIEEHAITAFGQGAEVLTRLWNMRPRSFGDVFGKENRFGQLKGERVLRSFLPAHLPENFEGLEIPFSAVATNFYDMSETVMRSGPLFEALAASSAIPGIFQPVNYNGVYHIDAAATNCLPFDHLSDDLDITIAIDIAGEPVAAKADRPPTSIDTVLGANMIMMRQMRELRLRDRQPDLLIQPPINSFGVQDFLKVKAILQTTEKLEHDLEEALTTLIADKLAGKAQEPRLILVQPGTLTG